MNRLTTTPELLVLQENFIRGKAAKDQWATYQREVEEAILAGLKAQGIPVPKTGSVKLEKVNITFVNARTWDDQRLAELAATHPHVIGSTLRVVYEPAITKPKIDKIVASGTEFGEELKECFEDKARKPSMTIA